MLQQTQVATVREYFLAFVRRWPDVVSLANAPQEEVLKAWAGLGYYSRARNLKKCAERVVDRHGAQFPDTTENLKELPGIGEYTAAAIAAIAFNEPEVVIDGNVERVISRYLAISTVFPQAKTEVRAFLGTVIDKKRPGDFAQAMMDLGATVCKPKTPSCMICPLSRDCAAYQAGNQESYPIKKPKPGKPVRKGAAFVLQNSNGDVFLCKREGSGLLAAMTQVPTTNWNSQRDGATEASAGPVTAPWRHAGRIRHTFTHFHLELEVWHAFHDGPVSVPGWWSPAGEIDREALPNLMRKTIAAATKTGD